MNGFQVVPHFRWELCSEGLTQTTVVFLHVNVAHHILAQVFRAHVGPCTIIYKGGEPFLITIIPLVSEAEWSVASS